jgi:hypothetical protein
MNGFELCSCMEWALANGEVADTRRVAFALDQMVRKNMPPAAGALPAPPDIVFPATRRHDRRVRRANTRQ